MAEVYPFIGTRYNSQLIGNLARVVSPPYESAGAELQQELYDRHEHNVIRIEHAVTGGEDDSFSNRFTRAANTLATWRSDGIFIEDERPSFYVYQQEYRGADGAPVTRLGFFAKIKLHESATDYESSGHPLGDRVDLLNLLRATKANISPIVSLFDDANSAVADVLAVRMQDKPWEEFTDEENVTHRLWVLQKKDMVLSIVDSLKQAELYIADGQHRYIAAQIYRDEMRQETGKTDGKQPFDYAMALLVPVQQPHVQFNAVHRALTKSVMADVDLRDALEELEENFEVTKSKIALTNVCEEAQQVQQELERLSADAPTVALIHASGMVCYLQLNAGTDLTELYDDETLPPDLAGMDSSILHNYIINQVMIGNPEYQLESDECLFVESAEQLLTLLQKRKAQCGFVLRPITVDRMMEIARTTPILPLENTAITPSPVTGLVLRNMTTDVIKPVRK